MLEALSISDRAYVLQSQRIVLQGTGEELLSERHATNPSHAKIGLSHQIGFQAKPDYSAKCHPGVILCEGLLAAPKVAFRGGSVEH
jgi:hypothetical protein